MSRAFRRAERHWHNPEPRIHSGNELPGETYGDAMKRVSAEERIAADTASPSVIPLALREQMSELTQWVAMELCDSPSFEELVERAATRFLLHDDKRRVPTWLPLVVQWVCEN